MYRKKILIPRCEFQRAVNLATLDAFDVTTFDTAVVEKRRIAFARGDSVDVTELDILRRIALACVDPSDEMVVRAIRMRKYFICVFPTQVLLLTLSQCVNILYTYRRFVFRM